MTPHRDESSTLSNRMPADGETTITILDARLKLVHVPRSRLQTLMSPIIDCWWFRDKCVLRSPFRPTKLRVPGSYQRALEVSIQKGNKKLTRCACRKDPFFALSVNGLEVSIFADAEIVARSFGPYMREEQDEQDDLLARAEARETVAGGSSITLGAPGARLEMESPEPAREESVKVGQGEWVALEISFHGDGWGAPFPLRQVLKRVGANASFMDQKRLGSVSATSRRHSRTRASRSCFYQRTSPTTSS